MLEIERILRNVRLKLRDTEDPYDVIFSAKEITCLSSSVSLCALKLKCANNFNVDTLINNSLSIEELHELIKGDDDLLLVLRYCALRNQYLDKAIQKIWRKG